MAEEGAAFGAALLAGVGVGGWPSLDAACDVSIKVAQQIIPAEAQVQRYAEGYKGYRKVYPALKGIHG